MGLLYTLGRSAGILAAFIFFAMIAGCGAAGSTGESLGNGANIETTPVIAVTTGRAESRDVSAAVQATGSMVADETSDIAPKTAGRISNVSVNVGEFVSQGSLIAKIDDRDARLELASANAAVKQAIAGVRQAEARLGLTPNGKFNASTIPEVRAANADYEQSLAELRQLETNEQRYRELVETGDVSMIVYENHRTLRDVQRARVNSARQQLDAAVNAAKQNNQAISTAEASVETARTQVATAEKAIADTVIRAPYSGFVSSRPVAVGEYVSSASVIATLLRTNPIKVEIKIAEADLPFVTIGRGVSIGVDAYRDRNFAGTVTGVNPAIDPVSRSAVIEAAIENGSNLLRAGMFATVKINKEGGSKAVFIPKSAVYNDQSTQSHRVFVIQEGITKLRVVQLGIEEGDMAQILTGVNADEIVATSNLSELFEGARVSVGQ